MSLPMVGFTALPHVGGILGGFIRRREVYTWYASLKKPSWCPPNGAFPVVWTSLYTGMGYGSYLIWKELGGFTEDAVVPMGLYGLQLALNWASVPLFFGVSKFYYSTMLSWYPVSRTASLLLAPYLAWMCYTTAIRYCIWRDNPDKKE
uniref:Translocator protein n=1 Tax=Poecilia reticulata TaxID=8081 RepID=A0A3P9N032_POERE